jgi:drug/metabolite transporter (DMT)-like permease
MGIALLVINDALSKFLTESYPVGQVVSIRQALGLLVILPYVHWISGWRSLEVHDWRGQAARGVLFTIGSSLMVLSLSLLPIATVISINFVSPLVIAALSGPLLGEQVSARRWLVIALGFAGVLVIIRPGGAAFEWALLVPVAVALINSVRDILTRRLARTESTISVLFWSSNVVAALTACSAVFGWKPIETAALGWFMLVGIVNAGSHFLMIEAFRRARAASVAPLRYTGLVWAALFGYLFWGDVPDLALIAGSLLVIVSGLLLIRWEAQNR